MIVYLLSTTVDDAAGSMIFPNDKPPESLCRGYPNHPLSFPIV
jgi:hypothetical protein